MRIAFLAAGFLACLSLPALAQDVTCYDGTKLPAGQAAACSRHGGVLAPGQEGALLPDTGRHANRLPDTAPPTADTQIRPRSTRGALQSQQAPGGGPGEVWVNASSKAYHCSTDRYYGRTKRGSYMTEAAAKASGAHASGGKACS